MFGAGNGVGLNVKPTRYVIFDDFNRPDQLDLGIATSGQTWIRTATGFTINNNQAKTTGAQTGIIRTYIPATKNVLIGCTFTEGSSQRIIFRFIDGANEYYLIVSNSMNLIRRVGGTATTVAQYALTPYPNMKIEISVLNDIFTIRLDGNIVIKYSTDALLDAANVGFSASAGISCNWDNFKVVEIK